ncbi:TlpA disulfide reductase family protein [Flavivirga amylovorans]|uniref:TlpA disulfide reductase family protein n=1 Tax=Flavivirga amylovorans TaxID=870486 RepID=A0ABT8X0T4_9FLAO|nr:TlpA disulfide reductase family protein [Flavivirga amylovorans]MDO5987530.1 TlpA disulfide reductase family protein [Flavivirga amylovorans]
MLLFSFKSNAQQEYLKIGDKAPPINVHSWLKNKPITEFQRGKAYIVEFGATWCRGCTEMIPYLTHFSDKYSEELEVMGVFVKETNMIPETVPNKKPKYIDRVNQYIERQGDRMQYSVAVDGPEKYMENYWINASGFSGLPKTFIIDKEGYIAAMGIMQPKTIDSIISQITLDKYNRETVMKKASKVQAMPFDSNKLLYLDNNGGENPHFEFRSVLAKSKGEIIAGNIPYVTSNVWMSEDNESLKGRVQAINVPLEQLYYLAYADTLRNVMNTRLYGTNKYFDTIVNPYRKSSYGKYWQKPILEVTDKSLFIWDKNNYNSPKNKWHYSLKVPKEKNTARFLQKVMRSDLRNYFGYDVTVETREMPCWYLKAEFGAAQNLKTKTPGRDYESTSISKTSYKFTNAEIRDILSRFYFSYHNNKKSNPEMYMVPFIDATAITTEIDYDITSEEFQNFKKDFNSAKAYIKRFGLYLEKGTKTMKVVVIRDPKELDK